MPNRSRWGYLGHWVAALFFAGATPSILVAGAPQGACCPTEGDCLITAATACRLEHDGVYLGDGIECPQDGPCLGVCCVDHECFESVSWTDCFNQGSVLRILESKCAVSTCTIALCESNADCQDGNACDGEEACTFDLCQEGTAPDCDDDNICTTDTCNLASGCRHTPAGDPDCGACCTPWARASRRWSPSAPTPAAGPFRGRERAAPTRESAPVRAA